MLTFMKAAAGFGLIGLMAAVVGWIAGNPVPTPMICLCAALLAGGIVAEHLEAKQVSGNERRGIPPWPEPPDPWGNY